MSEITIREASTADFPQILNIYNHYIQHTLITFDVEVYTLSQMTEKLIAIQKNHPLLVAHQDEVILGYAYAAAWKSKEAYKHSAETTIYMHPEHKGGGIGTRLYRGVLASLPLFDVVNAIACITIPNEESIHLHQKLDFVKVGRFEKVGFKHEQWIDVEYWQKSV